MAAFKMPRISFQPMPQVLMHISNFSREREVSQQSELTTLKVIIRDFMKAMELA